MALRKVRICIFRIFWFGYGIPVFFFHHKIGPPENRIAEHDEHITGHVGLWFPG